MIKNILWPILLLICLVGLIPQSALALSASEYSIVYANPGSGMWYAVAVTEIIDDGSGQSCISWATVQMTITENGGQVWYGQDAEPNGRAEVDYYPVLVVDLNSTYTVNSGHSFTPANTGQTVYGSSTATMTTPSVPYVTLQLIDATNPNLVTINYAANPAVLYSSQVTVGGLSSISGSPGNPNFYFNQNNYPGVGGGSFVTTTPIVFQGYLYGHYINGPACSVTVNEQVNIYTDGGHRLMYTPGDPDRIGSAGFVDVQHIVDGSATAITYCTQPVGGSLTDRMLDAWGNLSTQNNSCVNLACDITNMNEVNYYQTFSDALGPEIDPTTPPQGVQPGGWYFLSRQLRYNPPHWLPQGTQSQTCNTLVFIGDNIGAWGCTPLVWP